MSRVATFGLSGDVDWQAHDVGVSGERGGSTRFRVRHERSPFGTFEVPLVGLHNVRNALAAIAVAAEEGVSAERIASALGSFAGVKRRLELVGTAAGVAIYDDFAHHPTAVAETLSAVRSANPDARIWAVFEPRSASSCRRVFQEDFARAFAAATQALIAPVFRSKLAEGERLSVSRLVSDLNERGTAARAVGSVDEIIDIIVREHRDHDIAVLMSNGGFGGIHRRLLKALS